MSGVVSCSPHDDCLSSGLVTLISSHGKQGSGSQVTCPGPLGLSEGAGGAAGSMPGARLHNLAQDSSPAERQAKPKGCGRSHNRKRTKIMKQKQKSELTGTITAYVGRGVRALNAPSLPCASPHVATRTRPLPGPHSRSPGTARLLGPRSPVMSLRRIWGEWAPSQPGKKSCKEIMK